MVSSMKIDHQYAEMPSHAALAGMPRRDADVQRTAVNKLRLYSQIAQPEMNLHFVSKFSQGTVRVIIPTQPKQFLVSECSLI